jgi:hypothetical protein
MYLVGLYSPKEKSGVTELSLAIYQWLKMKTNLSVAFISYGSLEKESPSSELFHEFSKLSDSEQKRKVKQMKKEHDIIIYDASSQLSEGVLKLEILTEPNQKDDKIRQINNLKYLTTFIIINMYRVGSRHE